MVGDDNDVVDALILTPSRRRRSVRVKVLGLAGVGVLVHETVFGAGRVGRGFLDGCVAPEAGMELWLRPAL